MPEQAIQQISKSSPFCLSNSVIYQQWREQRLPYTKPAMSDLLVRLANPHQLSSDEKVQITQRCDKFNMAVYQLENSQQQEKSLVHALGKQLQMERLDTNLRSDEDSVSSLQVRAQEGNQYIPYTNKALSWHTDGYYNPLDKQVFGIIMHCVSPAAEGGINALLNPEDVYIKLRDKNPAYIVALMKNDAMTIPDNIEHGKVIRAAQTGPVFFLKPDGRLHMRFSARKRNIIWKDTAVTKQAVEMINALMADEKNILKVALTAGQGIICNNVLHNRSGFVDTEQQKRLMYRARYYDAVLKEAVNSE